MRENQSGHNRSRRGRTMRVGLSLAIVSAGVAGCMASTQEEVAMGSQYAAEINRQLPKDRIIWLVNRESQQ